MDDIVQSLMEQVRDLNKHSNSFLTDNNTVELPKTHGSYQHITIIYSNGEPNFFM